MASQTLTRQHIALIARDIGEQTVLDMVADGKSQKAIANYVSEVVGKPVSAYYVHSFLHRDEDASARYKAARLAAASGAAGKINDITDELLEGKRDPSSVKVASDNLKWIAAKADPATYSDKAQLDIQVTDLTALHLESLRQRMRDVTPE
jgi:hypothetical protein